VTGSAIDAERALRSSEHVVVFIENEAGSRIKNLHDEVSLRHTGCVHVARAYPYPYGFVLDTRNDDGDGLDCYVLTGRVLRRGDLVECVPVGLMEQLENGERDHNVLATLPDEAWALDEGVRRTLTEFVSHVFDGLPERRVQAGAFGGAELARAWIERCRALRNPG
jgi:inorganic pyrophosphatase